MAARAVRFLWPLLVLVGIGVWLLGTRDAGMPAVPGSSAPVAAPAGEVASDASRQPTPATRDAARALPAFLPPQARDTIARIQRGGPFPHRQDGGVFGNREGHLPRKPRGWYREYTVDTPGLRHRGARRIVTGGTPPSEWYYTDDHYDSFRAFSPPTDGGPP